MTDPATAPPPPARNAPRALTAAAMAAALAAAAVIGIPVKKQWEGRSLVPYRDIAGIWTVCDGETRVAMRRYTPAECDAMTERAWYQFGAEVLKCSPELAGDDRRYQLAAAVVFAYNVGSARYCASTAARHFRAGDWRGGCDALLLFNKARVNGELRVVRGLDNRRRAERAICIKGL